MSVMNGDLVVEGSSFSDCRTIDLGETAGFTGGGGAILVTSGVLAVDSTSFSNCLYVR